MALILMFCLLSANDRHGTTAWLTGFSFLLVLGSLGPPVCEVTVLPLNHTPSIGPEFWISDGSVDFPKLSQVHVHLLSSEAVINSRLGSRPAFSELKKRRVRGAWCHTPAIPSLEEAEAGGCYKSQASQLE